MTVKGGKIIQATESELYEFYLKRGYDDLMSFTEYKRKCIENGMEVINGAEKETV